MKILVLVTSQQPVTLESSHCGTEIGTAAALVFGTFLPPLWYAETQKERKGDLTAFEMVLKLVQDRH